MGVVSERKLSFTARRRNRCDSCLFHGPRIKDEAGTSMPSVVHTVHSIFPLERFSFAGVGSGLVWRAGRTGGMILAVVLETGPQQGEETSYDVTTNGALLLRSERRLWAYNRILGCYCGGRALGVTPSTSERAGLSVPGRRRGAPRVVVRGVV